VISLTKWDEPVIKVGLSGDYHDEDVEFLNDLAREFNSLSTTTKIQVQEGMEYQPVELILLPESFVSSMRFEGHGADLVDVGPDGTQHVYLRSENPPHAPYPQKRYYISNDIPGSRNYTIKRAFLDAMGFGGYSDEEGSFFSSKNSESTNLTTMDRAVIILMYELPFRQNDTIDVVNKYLH
jgi:hypothetical protein